MAATSVSSLHAQCSRRQKIDLIRVEAHRAGRSEVSGGTGGQSAGLGSEFVEHYALSVPRSAADPVGALPWLSNVTVSFRPSTVVSDGGLVVGAEPVYGFVRLSHAHESIQVSVVRLNADRPDQSPRYSDGGQLVTSPDPVRVLVLSAVLHLVSE